MISPYVTQAVLALLLATLLSYHLHLYEQYQQLKISCENKYERHEAQATKNANERFHHAGAKASLVMHSSVKSETGEEKDFHGIERNGYMKDYEPTLHNKNDGTGIYVTFSSSVDQQGEKTVLETSTAESQKSVASVIQFKGNNLAPEIMASTFGYDAGIHSSQSQSPSLELTKKNGESSQKNSHVNEQQNISQNLQVESSIGKIHKSTTQEQEKIYDFKISEETNTLDASTNEMTIEDKSEIQRVVSTDLFSSQLMEEKELFVLETSSQQIVPDDVNYDHKVYFETQGSTPVLNTAHNAAAFSLQADITDFVENIEGINCGSYACDFEEKLQHQEIPTHSMDVENEDEIYDNEYIYDNEKFDGGENDVSPETIGEDLIVSLSKEDSNDFVEQGTSAWCNKAPQPACAFQNLCYHTQERDFVFFKGKNSVVESLEVEEERTSHDFFDINLSTIQEHNTQMLSVVTLSAEYADTFSIGMVQKRTVAMNRFKPDNIMHVLHDDILPLFDTLNDLRVPRQGNAFDVAIVFTDIYEPGSYIDLYSSLSAYRPFPLWKLNQTYDLLCFSDIQVGLKTSTVWYQYGFFKPQGPVAPVHENVVEKIQRASTFLSKHFHSDCFFCKQGNYLVFLRRKDNRLIVNDGELIMAVTRSTRLKVMSVSLETHSLSDIITTVRMSRGIFGMHGSLFSLAIFLPPGSVLIELFPFAVDPSKYTPFKTYCNLATAGIIYKPWANPHRDQSVPHPDKPASEGGIHHLPESKQEEITSQTSVPEHLCCEDPSWLYHIYQDTRVDVKAVVSLVMEALHEAKDIPNSSQLRSAKPVSIHIPGSVKNLQCTKGEGSDSELEKNLFALSWEAPWTSIYEEAPVDYSYEIVIQDENKDSSMTDLPSNQLFYEFELRPVQGDVTGGVYVWVRVLTTGGHKSQSKFVQCVR